MPLKPVSVTQLNDYLNRVVSTDPLLSSVTVQGEVSGVKYHSSGHVYFSLVDSRSRLSCFLHREKAMQLQEKLTDGMELTVSGGITVFSRGGSYSLYVRSLEIEGKGDLAAAFEQMKRRLDREGLFDPAHKKPLPPYPDRIGVITAGTGAAIRDILKIIRKRNNVCDVVVFPTAVQGDGAAEKIARAIDFVNENFNDIDILIVGRGGGSAEDLWAFNEEAVARSIYASRIPIISAVGHEIDFSISDLVADVRAETPTAAAQIAVPDTEELSGQLETWKEQLRRQLENSLMYQNLKVENQIRMLRDGLESKISGVQNRLEQYRTVLRENDPRRILAQGYSIVEDSRGRVMLDANLISPEETYRITFHNGSAEGRLKKTGDGNDE